VTTPRAANQRRRYQEERKSQENALLPGQACDHFVSSAKVRLLVDLVRQNVLRSMCLATGYLHIEPQNQLCIPGNASSNRMLQSHDEGEWSDHEHIYV
jgi:hypothetical protein